MPLNTVEFTGVISSVTANGRFAVVELNDESRDHLGDVKVIISRDTRGRMGLMNGKGYIAKDTPVTGFARFGPEALDAVEVSVLEVV